MRELLLRFDLGLRFGLAGAATADGQRCDGFCKRGHGIVHQG